MTTPTERTRAVQWVYEQARDLHNAHYRAANKSVRIPVEEWEQFMRLFRHYPTSGDLALSHDKCQDVWGEPDVPNRP